MTDSSLPRVLMLTHRVPYPPDRGDRIRSYHLLKLLAEHAEVSLATLADEPVNLDTNRVLHGLTRQLAIVPLSRWAGRCRAAGAILRGRAVTPEYHYDRKLAATITAWQTEQPFDAVLTFCSGMVRYTRLIPHASAMNQKGAKHVMDLVDVDSVKWAGYAMNSLPPRRWIYTHESRQLRKIESGVHDCFDAMTVVSDREYKTYRHHVGENPRLSVVGNGVDLQYFKPLADAASQTILFTGVMNYRPNIEGAAWFAREVMPLIHQTMPNAVFKIVGRDPVRQVCDLNTIPGVEVVGSVPDMRPYLAEAGVVVAPLRIARGVQNKVLEAMACARVVVCSPQAAEGVDAMDGTHLLVGHSPAQWARHIDGILASPSRRHELSQSARQCVEQRYTWSARLAPMLDLLLSQPQVMRQAA